MPNVSDWRKALEEAGLNADPEGMSTKEIQAVCGFHRAKVRALIREGIAAGLVVHAGTRKQTAIDGVNRPVPLYRLKEEPSE